MKAFLRFLAFSAALIATVAVCSPLRAEEFAPNSQCGLQPGAKIVRVTTLAPKGNGSLDDAVKKPGAKIIIFDVGGTIRLGSDIDLRTPFVTLAGETAPEPGVTLVGGTLRVHSHDVCIRHISVRPGPSSDPEVSGVRDGIAIGGNPAKYGGPIQNVIVENVSVSWAIDENLSVWHAGTNNVQIRNSIISEALRAAGHPKGNHSMGLLIGSDVFDIDISGVLFAHNNDRNPRISPRTIVSLSNSVIYDPGKRGTETFLDCTAGKYPVRLRDNVFMPGPSTYRKASQYEFVDDASRDSIHPGSDCKTGFDTLTIERGNEVEITGSVLRYAGSRPAQRNEVDARIVKEVRSGGGAIVDSPPESAQTLERSSEAQRAFVLPEAPFAKTQDGRYAIAVSLCNAHLKLGGAPYRGCEAQM
ncbi:pectate lyase [Rhizobium hidalgonense]|uniref:pectate lyase n=1 Tax=Rhizobium hidalgonense TaxID=1538159 RepID=UPI002872A8FA|nr:pectate lyase [Rhizobium hidalgonense]MDR9805505.1 pectate lyase [Rhizobium hidalgonense]